MSITKILGKVTVGASDYGVAKLENHQYAVGYLCVGDHATENIFESLHEAIDYWFLMMPAHLDGSARQAI